MNIVRILFEIVVVAGLLYIIWFSCFMEKVINFFRKNQDKIIEKNVDHIEQIASERIQKLNKAKQFLESDIETVTNIKKRVSKSTSKKAKQNKTNE